MTSRMRDIQAYLASRFGAAGIDGTAGGAGDNTEVDGAWIDRQGFESVVAYVVITATLGAGETCTVIGNLQASATAAGASPVDIGTAPAALVLTSVGGGTEVGVLEIPGNLVQSDVARYIRAQFTPDLSAANTDTFEASMVYVLGGADVLPAS